jgi:phospholipase A1
MQRFFVAVIVLATVASALVASSARAASDCTEIRDDTARLRCYDAAAAVDTEAVAEKPASVGGIWAERMRQDAERDTFTLTARKPNYLMYTAVSSPNEAPYEFTGDTGELDDNEIKFQLSFQTKLADDLFDRSADLWFSYTQVSFWQLFNDDISAPFRETNYEPDVFVSFETDYNLLGLTGRVLNFGVVHQSNGRAEPLSRSWNRVYAELQFTRGDFALSVKPWVRIEEDEEDDDNPDIDDYLGNYELRAYYNWRGHVFSAMARNVIDSDDRYNSEIAWSFPITRRLRGLVQWYNGYGENLIDYNHNNHRIGIGVLLTDWL